MNGQDNPCGTYMAHNGKLFGLSSMHGSASACKFRHSANCWGRERFWKAHDV